MNEKTKRGLLAGLIILSLVPAATFVPLPTHVTAKSLSLFVSQITGYIGLLLLLWMYIIGARSVFALWFRDLAPILKLHKLLGKYGSIAILLHPLLVAYYYGESVLYSVIPHLSTNFERHVTLGRIAFLLVVVVWVTSVLMRKKLGHRPWKYIHYLAYISLPFALLHIPDVGSGFMSSVALKAYYLVVLLTLLIFSLLRLRGWLDSDKTSYRINRHSTISQDTYLLELTPLGGTHIRPRTGQYVYLKVGAVSEDHPFSVLGYDEGSGAITLGYRVFGRYTKFLRELPVGTTVRLSGPYGQFLHEIQPDAPFVCIAGGIGITPFVQPLLKQDNGWLFYANRSHETATLAEQLRARLGNRYVGVFSREDSLLPGEEAGYIRAELLKRRLSSPQDFQYFICGPEPMVESAIATLEELGVNPAQVFTESFEF